MNRVFEEEEAPPPAELWVAWGLQVNGNGIPYTNLHNASLILEADPAYKDKVYYDEFLQRVIRKNSPIREWGDADDLELARHIQHELAIPRMGREAVSQAVISVASKRKRNCVREWLDPLKWDSQPRINKFFSDYMGAKDDEYTDCASRNFWVSMAARVYKPGCKVDNMVILEGPQGIGKSSALQVVGGPYFAEQHESATNPKAFAEILQGKLLVEISEMESFSKAEVNSVKQTISCPSDRFRPAYGRHATDHPRTCVFVGTTNRDDWNRDETGARRFWPIACSGNVDLEGIRENRDQLFAEAKTRFLAGETHWKMPLDATRREQEDRYQFDAWHDKVVSILKGKEEITAVEALTEMGLDTLRQGRSEQMRLAAILRFLGWKKTRKSTRADRSRVYVSPDNGVQPVSNQQEDRLDTKISWE